MQGFHGRGRLNSSGVVFPKYLARWGRLQTVKTQAEYIAISSNSENRQINIDRQILLKNSQFLYRTFTEHLGGVSTVFFLCNLQNNVQHFTGIKYRKTPGAMASHCLEMVNQRSKKNLLSCSFKDVINMFRSLTGGQFVVLSNCKIIRILL